ncbi:hypothetical protein ACFVZH_37095 [Streptomyces sp. NPDC059534]|uniref:hypothetical protein n=1 Tax=Streptomyces sp. NPDC059534 TaxID=3346859 RepID=UPI0036A6C9CC
MSHVFLGAPREVRYECETSERAAYAVIGANVVAGFTPIQYALDVEGRRWRTPEGELLTVVAMTGSAGLISAFVFVGGC